MSQPGLHTYERTTHQHLMTRPRLIRGLRIAWSVWWGMLCVLLIVLWVRSYWRWDSPHGPISETRWMQLNSIRGYLFVGISDRYEKDYENWKWRGFRASSLTDSGATGTVAWDFTWKVGALGFGVVESNQIRFVYMPYWFFAIVAVTLAVFCWSEQSWRFSLRTLLIATTLIAVALGLTVWATG